MNTTVCNIKDAPADWKSNFQYVYIGRGSQWGNPFIIGRDGDRPEVIDKYRKYLEDNQHLIKKLGQLRGRTLVCFCKPDDCHGDILMNLTNLLHPNGNS